MPGPKKTIPREMISSEIGQALVALWTGDGDGRLTDRELREACQFLLANPDFIQGPFGKVIYQVLQTYVAETPVRPLSAKEVAAMVDQFVADGMPLTKARLVVARATRKTVEAVKQAHWRNRANRDKSE